jgi:hypothetical protein
VVRKARETSQETAGAQAGGEIAAYLRGAGDTNVGENTETILASLTGNDAAPEAAQETPVPAPEVAPEVTESRLQGLTDAPEKNLKTPAETNGAPKPSADLLAAEQKLKDLLNSNSKDN